MLGNVYMTTEEIIKQYNLKLTETNGDIKFYENEKGNQYQQIQDGEIFKVKDGSISYKAIKQINGCIIKYNTNGIYGFSVFKGGKNLEDRIWTLVEAERIAKELN
ncbi:MAG: hypothetical protein PHT02_01235 [Tissierellia bacterium]|nr:hypothetical protein [Tissierellia bacterium]